VLHPLDVPGVGDLPLVDPVAVAGAAGLDLLHVRVDLLLLGRQVTDRDAGVTRLVVELPAPGLEGVDLGQLGQARQLVSQLVGPGVDLLDVEQLQLGGRVGFQRGLLVRVALFRYGRSTGRCDTC
jgi:hypothetical protein